MFRDAFTTFFDVRAAQEACPWRAGAVMVVCEAGISDSNPPSNPPFPPT